MRKQVVFFRCIHLMCAQAFAYHQAPRGEVLVFKKRLRTKKLKRVLAAVAGTLGVAAAVALLYSHLRHAKKPLVQFEKSDGTIVTVQNQQQALTKLAPAITSLHEKLRAEDAILRKLIVTSQSENPAFAAAAKFVEKYPLLFSAKKMKAARNGANFPLNDLLDSPSSRHKIHLPTEGLEKASSMSDGAHVLINRRDGYVLKIANPKTKFFHDRRAFGEGALACRESRSQRRQVRRALSADRINNLPGSEYVKAPDAGLIPLKGAKPNGVIDDNSYLVVQNFIPSRGGEGLKRLNDRYEDFESLKAVAEAGAVMGSTDIHQANRRESSDGLVMTLLDLEAPSAYPVMPFDVLSSGIYFGERDRLKDKTRMQYPYVSRLSNPDMRFSHLKEKKKAFQAMIDGYDQSAADVQRIVRSSLGANSLVDESELKLHFVRVEGVTPQQFTLLDKKWSELTPEQQKSFVYKPKHRWQWLTKAENAEIWERSHKT